jgi:hypothetical protein
MSNHFSGDNPKFPGDGRRLDLADVKFYPDAVYRINVDSQRDERTSRVIRGAATVALLALGVGIDRVRGQRGRPAGHRPQRPELGHCPSFSSLGMTSPTVGPGGA